MVYTLITSLLFLFASNAAHAGDIDTRINEFLTPISNAISGFVFYSIPISGTEFPLVLGWLILASVVFTLYFGFIQLKSWRHSWHLVRGHYSGHANTPGETSHFQALTMALSGTVGLGNIAGVAVAISIGGAGATFWMILAGFLGMATKFTECTLALKYRIYHADGSVSGGPFMYLSQGLAELGLERTGKVLAVFFAICCVGGSIGAGNMFQANQAYQQVVNVTGGSESFLADKAWLFGLVLAIFIGMVIIGGVQSIARASSRIVPFMVVVYVTTCLFVLLSHFNSIPWAFSQIIDGAFTGDGVAGGVVGVLIQGFKRAAFSNEAGLGSAPIAHATARTKEPVAEGYVALLEPFIDTVVICTMTALAIIITGRLDNDTLTGVALTSDAFASVIPWFPYVLAVSVVLFAFSTSLAWFYYGLKSITYLVGKHPSVDMGFKLFFCACAIIGASMSLGPVIDFSDAMIFMMTIPNVIGLYLLMPIVKRELRDYRQRLKDGDITRSSK